MRREIAMKEINIYAFRNGAETRTMEYGRLKAGEAYVTETERGTSRSSATTRRHGRRR
jgi:hypothetical protein